MLKRYLSDKGISIYQLAKKSSISYSTVNDVVNGKVSIDNCKVYLLRKLADALCISMEELYDICKDDRKVITDYNVEGQLYVKNKSYYVKSQYGELDIDVYLCPVNELTSYYIDEIAKWRLEYYIRKERLENPWNISL